jgi:hypothetical protein
MIQLAWRFLRFQKDSALAQWYQARTADMRGATRKTMIVALARKLLVALWRLVTTGEVPDGVIPGLRRGRLCARQRERPRDPRLFAEFSAPCQDRRTSMTIREPAPAQAGVAVTRGRHGVKRRPREWARRPEPPHGSSPWAEGSPRCA